MANETKVYVGKKGAQTIYKRLKDLIGKITTYQKVTNTTESGVPIVTNPNSRTIYLVKDNTVVGDDKYKEWIWTSDLGWECIGTTSIPENAWKQWAEDNGSVGTTDTVYLGKNNNLARTWSFGFGNNNTSSSTLDNVDWSGSDVVMIGSFNSAIDAAGAYQVGFRNSVVNNHRMSEASPYYNYYTAINFGNGNEIDAEGMNLGKDNTAADFGMNIGQHNTANRASISIGERVSTDQASISIGTDSIAENKSLSIGFGSVAAGVLYNNGEFLHSGEYGGSFAIGINHLCAAKNSIAIGSGVTTADTYSIVSGGSFAILAEGIHLAQQASYIYGNSFGVGSCLTLTSSSFSIGRFNTADNYSYAIGERNTVNWGSFVIGQNNTLIGGPNGANYAYGYAFAAGRDLNDVQGRSCTFGIGNNHITHFAYAAGLGNYSIHDNAVAVGIENDTVYYHSTAVGANNNNIHGDGVAVGNGNRDIRDMGTAVGSYNYEVYSGSFAAGEANSAQNGSIAIGISNKARGGGMLFGIGNYAIAYPNDSYYISYHANSVVMGFGNEVYNVREGLHKSGWTKSITTCGIAIGAYIKAYGHNFISFGSSNTLGDGANWMNDTAENTENDGFMTAIGFQCTTKRNYDFAYGYQSVADGGENIAFQHSSARGYRNIAMVDATALGTENISLIESKMTINLPNVTNQCSRNVLHHSMVNHYTSLQTDYLGFNDNILAGSTVNTSGQWVLKNTLIHGAITGPARVCESNIVLTGSSITLSGNIESVRNNILANNASLLESPYTAFCNNSTNHPVSENFLLGTYAENTYGCFSMSDIDAALRLSNSTRVFNFGDNTIFNTNDVTVFGGKNDIKGVKFVFTNGHLNTISSEKTYSDDAPGDIYVMGAKNTVKLIDDSSVSEKSRCDRIYVSGTDNTIQGTLLFENYIFGNGNKLQTPSPIQTSSGQIGESDTNKYCARNSIIGNNNNIQSNVTDYTIIGLQNTLSNKLGPDVQPSWSNSISSGFIQGNNNEASNGSNIISMGNGNVSTGHNSIAIGCQLISNQWQTVLGKYNAAIDGPNRLASETPQDPTKALLIVGNGYSTKDDKYWQDETYITRSNALELYADGRLKISGKIEASNIPPAPVADGQYALACDVVSGVATYRWVAVGIN